MAATRHPEPRRIADFTNLDDYLDALHSTHGVPCELVEVPGATPPRERWDAEREVLVIEFDPRTA